MYECAFIPYFNVYLALIFFQAMKRFSQFNYFNVIHSFMFSLEFLWNEMGEN